MYHHPASPIKHVIKMGIGALLLIGPLYGCATPNHNSHNTVFRVEKSCQAVPNCFNTVQSALDATPTVQGDTVAHVKIGAGDFREKVTVQRPNTLITGQGSGRTRIHFDMVAEYAKDFHRNGWGTPGSATFTVNANQVTVRDITIENDFDYLANDVLDDANPAKIFNSQAVAVLLDIDSDMVIFERTAMLGYQDTLFANGRRAIVRESLIAGNIDFIFGNGQLLVEDSEVRTRRRASNRADGEFHSFIAAPSTQLTDPVGLVFYRSRLTREGGVPDDSVALARPWHPTTRFPDGRYADPNAVGQALFIECVFGEHIHPDYWASMPGTARDGTKTAIFLPEDSRFGEIGSTGPGISDTPIKIKWKADMDMLVIRSWMLADRSK